MSETIILILFFTALIAPGLIDLGCLIYLAYLAKKQRKVKQ